MGDTIKRFSRCDEGVDVRRKECDKSVCRVNVKGYSVKSV